MATCKRAVGPPNGIEGTFRSLTSGRVTPIFLPPIVKFIYAATLCASEEFKNVIA